MKITLTQGSITETTADAAIVNLFEGVTQPGGATGALDQKIGGLISKLIGAREIKGELNETTVIHLGEGFPYRKVVVVGLGKPDEFSADRVRQVTAAALKAAATGETRRVTTIVHGAGIGGLDPATAAQALAEGALLGAYRYDEYKSEPSKPRIEELLVVEYDREKITPMQSGIEKGVILADSTNFARDLVNAPSNEVTPTRLAERARELAAETGLECSVLGREEMERLGMGSLLGVAKGSAEAPQMIVLRHRGEPGRKPVALVGKGVTFDTGGISIKPAAGMGEMKSDMAGGAAVIGAMRAIALLKLPQPVFGVVPCVENMPSGTALKPGDILRAMTGKTIEVDNTDAEGRLILADAVAYAETLGAQTIVDIATLTGACIIALGSHYSGIVANDDRLVEQILTAAAETGERFWRLPDHPDYKEQYKSDVADIKNTGGREGGAITGGLIIGEFIRAAKWAHLDIAGTSFSTKERTYTPKGGTGVAVRTLAEWVARL